MTRRLCAMAVLAASVLVPCVAQARIPRGAAGMVNTPWGMMNTNSPEYQQSGGDPEAYFNLLQQKQQMQQMQLMQKQQAQMQKQMQQYQQQQKQQGGMQAGQPTNGQSGFGAPTSSTAKKKKKKPTLNSTAAKTAPADTKKAATAPADSKTAAAAKPATAKTATP